MQYFYYILLALISYFVGNISFARILSKVNHGDVTKYGSGNPGTLNMWRRFGFWQGIGTFILDMLKGAIPTLLAYFIFKHFGLNYEIAVYIAGFFVILGHIFPVIFKFKGGKGIATSIGVFLVANWKVALIAFVIMVLCMLVIKYASIFTLGFVLIVSVVEIVLCNPANLINYILICGIVFIIFFAHRGNIVRLFKGKENKTELLKMVKGLFKKKNKEQSVLEENQDKPVNDTKTEN